MTTDPGDLVLDPTCGSGTTAYVAKKLKRNWARMNTQKLMVSKSRIKQSLLKRL